MTGFWYNSIRSLREQIMKRISVMVAHQTLTLFVRVRILHPLPKDHRRRCGDLFCAVFFGKHLQTAVDLGIL